MTTTDAQPADSSPAPVAPTPSLDSLTTAERHEWRKTGSLPDAAAASSPATPNQAPSTDGTLTPASEPGSLKSKKNAESRIQELLTERAQLRADLEAARRPSPPVPDVSAAPSPAPAGEKFPSYDRWITTQPDEVQNASDNFDLYIDARAGYVFQQQQQQARAREATEMAQRDEQTRLQTYQEAAAQYVAARPDYWAVIQPITALEMPQAVATALQDVITRSTNAPALLYHLGTHRDEFDRLTQLPPHQAAYQLGKLDGSLTTSASPVARTLSAAPPPPPSIGSKPATPVDDIEAAVKRGDFASYRLAMNRKTIAAR